MSEWSVTLTCVWEAVPGRFEGGDGAVREDAEAGLCLALEVPLTGAVRTD